MTGVRARFEDLKVSLADRRLYRAVVLENGLTALLVHTVEDPHSQAEHAGEDEWEDMDEDDDDDDDDDEDEEEEDGEDEDDDGCGDCEEEGEADGRRSKGASKSSDQMCAAALCVTVGNISDPDTLQGLAHFLEHMVFMGSEKYPGENDFDAFIKKHGGSTNASTDCEQTVFQFDVRPAQFPEALDRFAQFFVAPLMKESSTERELKAVDSEFEMNREEDFARQQQLLSLAANKGHPLGRFLWGNSESLWIQPNQKGIDVRAELFKFYRDHYVAERMFLCVVGKQDLDELEQLVATSFAGLQHGNATKATIPRMPADPFANPEFHSLTYLPSVKEKFVVELCWALPCMRPYYRSKPDSYVCDLLGFEGPGSVLSFLRNRGLATSLAAGNDYTGVEANSTTFLLKCSVGLTEEGMERVQQVVTIILQYVTLLRRSGPQKHLWDERSALAEISFRFEESMEPIDFAESVVQTMPDYPRQLWLCALDLFFEYDPMAIQMVLDCMTAANVRILISNRAIADKCTETEPWFGFQYSTVPFDDSWEQCFLDSETQPIPSDLTLPMPNEFIAQDFALKPAPVPAFGPNDVTELLRTANTSLRYQHNTVHLLPRTYATFHLVSPIMFNNLLTSTACDAFITIVSLQLKEITYVAQQADLHAGLSSQTTGLFLRLSGLSDKISLLLRHILNHLKSFSCDQNLFDIVKQQLIRRLRNAHITPVKYGSALRLKVLRSAHFLPSEVIPFAENLTLDHVMQLASVVFQHLEIHGLVIGNVSADEALSMMNMVATNWNCTPLLPPHVRPRHQCLRLPDRTRHFIVKQGLNATDDNCFIESYFQDVNESPLIEQVRVQLIEFLMEEPCFDQLRTQEGLGYDVRCSWRVTDGRCGYTLQICAQSSKFSVSHLYERIMAFLADFRKKLVSGLPNTDIAEAKTALAQLKRRPDNSISETMDRLWSEIEEEELMFDRANREADLIESITRAELIKCYDSVIFGGRSLHICVVGKSETVEKAQAGLRASCAAKPPPKKKSKVAAAVAATPKTENIVFIEDINQFITSCPLYPPRVTAL